MSIVGKSPKIPKSPRTSWNHSNKRVHSLSHRSSESSDSLESFKPQLQFGSVKKMKLAIVGLGYVGLPLAHAFAKIGHSVTGYDISQPRIDALKKGHDWTLELTDQQLQSVPMEFTTDSAAMEKCQVIILAIPTPVDGQNNPDLSLVESATTAVGKHLKKGMIVVYESTVYPGVTEEICGPILEKESGLKCGTDFTLGYSPERINPGDKKHTIDKIIKVVAGQDEKTTDILCDLYGSVVTAGIHRAPSIKVAEMAKAIENAQRDLNIAYVNEIALFCHRLGIETKDVLAAAGTKWNFLPFQPGLVGGHCIGVDPYYLVEKARQLGMKTQVITAGRGINEAMAGEVADQIARGLSVPCEEAKILVLGITFKENVPDTRNSKVHDVVLALQEKGCVVEVHDAELSDGAIAKLGYALGNPESGTYDAVALLVPHTEYLNEDILLSLTKENGLIYDLKSILDRGKIEAAGRTYAAL